MRVIGIDPSLSRLGLAMIDGSHTIEPVAQAFSLKTRPLKDKDLNSLQIQYKRMCGIADWTMAYILERPVVLVVIEGMLIGSNTPGTFDRSGLWWQLYGKLTRAGIPIAVIGATTRVKWATGMGNRDKDDVGIAVDRMWPSVGENNDERDALALATMGLQYLGLHLPVQQLVAQRAVLGGAGCKWPGSPQGILALSSPLPARKAVPGAPARPALAVVPAAGSAPGISGSLGAS